MELPFYKGKVGYGGRTRREILKYGLESKESNGRDCWRTETEYSLFAESFEV